MKHKRVLRGPFFWLTVLFVVAALVTAVTWSRRDYGELTYGEFLEHLEQGDVGSATIHSRSNQIEGELADGTQYQAGFDDHINADQLAEALTNAQIPAAELDVDTEPQNVFVTLLVNLLPFVVIMGLFIFLMMQMGGQGVLGFGRSRAKLNGKDMPTVTFDDVAGADEAVEDLKEIRDFLANPVKFNAIGAKIPRGVLLFGPPGTGKTLLARAVAGEAGVPFFTISGSDFVEMFVGVGASRVRDLFDTAKEQAPSIIFVDEIDAVGRHRGSGLGGGHDEREQTLNQLLVEMDGFDPNTGVILIAATNRPDILDPALLRPGRFDRQIAVDRPDIEGRKAILSVHARGKPIVDDVDLEVLAKRTPGFTGADLANLLNEAALLTARNGADEITMDALEASIDRVIAGPERRTKMMDEQEKRLIAYHEGGHTIVGHALPHADPIHKVSIISRGRALGWTLSLPMKDQYLVSRGELIDRLAMMLGGRVAEVLTIGDYTTGAADDIAKATETAREMVTQYGMSAALGPVQYGAKDSERRPGHEPQTALPCSGRVADQIDDEIAALLDEAHNEALEILVANRDVLETLAEALMEHETVEKELLADLLSRVEKRPSRKLKPLMGRVQATPDSAGIVATLRRGPGTDRSKDTKV